MIVLKLGGSVITEKGERETVDLDALARLAGVIGQAEVDDLVVVHGAGSFGHYYADEHGVSTTNGTRDARAVREIHDSMTRLNKAVLDYLDDAGVAGVPVRPFSAARRDDGLEFYTNQVEAMLAEGFTPVLHGDVVAESGAGATILSGDEVVTTLARQLDADRVGLCSTVPGVLDESDTVISEITAYDDVSDVLGGSEDTDVTGGMAGKVRELLALGAPASVFGADDLADFLRGENAGTTVRG
ncbi:isopentenyl phosphate kinase [Salarchaeum sp. JOR-1]|uniref:isopentenyl phosphate kinase n=1 Tax=Salarchaeum sp. JOR-1 TaxID=2599399 RepID=UPI00119893D7|nr:isopentenyl phosphate kinase [Salarchaeum sp. JOR-1]QDX40904.1 isopentenyl phosphate kinase family protein [Salarchaeum sp. JOR-1]